ncbi:MAG: SMC-Scp complex subunit ScpB [candidate division Zixibacteria bacterium]|nr:SMC-Scp complex subunit ScpB [candidate division Zixibacteria bacterium]
MHELIDQKEVKESAQSIVEALLFASDTPLTSQKISSLVENITPQQVEEIVDQLNQKYEEGNRSFSIRKVASGFQMYTLPDFKPWIEKLVSTSHSQKLSPAALEALAIIAYKQPVVKSEVEHIRGVDSDWVIHGLLEKNLITIVGRKHGLGRPLLYGTTPGFLSYFGLNSLDDLPKIEELEELMKQKECRDG